MTAMWQLLQGCERPELAASGQLGCPVAVTRLGARQGEPEPGAGCQECSRQQGCASGGTLPHSSQI